MDTTTYAVNNDPRSKRHILGADGITLCGTDAARTATAAEARRPVCFFCTTTAPAAGEGAEATVRMATVVVDYLSGALERGQVAVGDAPYVAAALALAPKRPAGRGFTHLVPLRADEGRAVLDHLTERLHADRPGVGFPRWRLERAVRMIAEDLAA